MTHRLTGTAYGLESDTRADNDWRHQALCRYEDPELFFPIGDSGPAILQIEQAKEVCRRCNVKEECLKWALGSGQDAGVWGGLSEEERRAIGSKRKGRHGGEYQAAKTHCPRNHRYDADNTYISPQGKRRCRICADISRHESARAVRS